MTKLRRMFCTTTTQRVIDALIVGVASYLAYQLRFEWQIPHDSARQMWLLLPAVVLAQALINAALGIYRLVWRYVGLTDALIISRGYLLLSAVLIVLRFGLPDAWALARVPVSVIVIEFMLALGASLGARSLRRLLYEGVPAKAWNGKSLDRVLLIGAGQAGAALARELGSRSDIKPIGFLDDDLHKQGRVISGLRVLGTLDDLASILAQYDIREVIVCIPRASRLTLKRVWAICEAFPVRTKIVPALEEILQGKTNIAAFRDVELSDLLGREVQPLGLNDLELARSYGRKRILITGGGGSIGSELACQLAKLEPAELILLDKDENGLHEACLRLQGAPNVHPVVADLRFAARLESVFSAFSPEVVFHAAAHKHVRLMELNPCEAILNNVVGTRNLVEASERFGVSRFVLISTDKAVKPTCVMGASKRLCEMVVQAQRAAATRFCCVRFGNVIGSRGSVVPIFQKQIARGGPLTVTHPDVERFLMTIPEAVRLLVRAGTLGSAGEIFVLDMGEPVRIQSLARDLIELSGLRPGQDIAIKFTRLGQGEKLSEELLDPTHEQLLPTGVDRVSVVRETTQLNLVTFARKLEAVEAAARQFSGEDVLGALERMGIGFRQPPKAAPAEATRALTFSPGKAKKLAAASGAAVTGAVGVES